DRRIAVALGAASRDVLHDGARRSAVPASADLRVVRSSVEHARLPDGMQSAVNAAIDARGRDDGESTAKADHLAATAARTGAMESNFPLIAHGFLRVVHVGFVQVDDLGTALVPAKLSAGEREAHGKVLRREHSRVEDFLRLVVELIVAREPLTLKLVYGQRNTDFRAGERLEHVPLAENGRNRVGVEHQILNGRLTIGQCGCKDLAIMTVIGDSHLPFLSWISGRWRMLAQAPRDWSLAPTWVGRYVRLSGHP